MHALQATPGLIGRNGQDGDARPISVIPGYFKRTAKELHFYAFAGWLGMPLANAERYVVLFVPVCPSE
jgi:hypothetical protein